MGPRAIKTGARERREELVRACGCLMALAVALVTSFGFLG